MKCSTCSKEMSFKSWFINAYKCSNCKIEEKSNKHILKVREETEEARISENKKVRFWDRVFWAELIVTFIVLTTYLFIPEQAFDNNLVIYPFLIIYLGFIILVATFRIGMIYHAFRLKRYVWGIVNLLFGGIFLIFFYFSILRKEFAKEK